MAKEKKRGFFSWLGFGQKDEAPAQEEQQVTEQPVEEKPAEAASQEALREEAAQAEPHTLAESETFAQEVVEVSEQVIEEQEKAADEAPQAAIAHEEPQQQAPAVEPEQQPEPEPETTAEIEHETLPLPEAFTAEADPQAWQPEQEQEEVIDEEELAALALAVQPEAVIDEVEAAVEDAVVETETAEETAEETEAVAPVVEQEKPTKEGFFARLKRSLVKTKENLGSGFISLFRGKKIDDDLFEELEEQLLIADVGVDTTRRIISNLTEGASRKQLRDAEALYGLLKEEMGEILAKVDEPLNIEGKSPFVILMVGVNGVGKTTTIGKLARQFEQQGKTVMLAAGDTFRAAAVEQLQVWGQRNNIPVIAQHTGADSASVIFDAIQAAKARNVDVLIADTAGRLQNKAHLMEELKKIVRVMKKLDVDAPHEVMLTIDASTGQNAVSQAKLFHEAVGLTGITLTKLDGTAKGGVIFSVADQFNIPIRYIGVGERIEDLRPFNAGDFIEALFARED